jgi:hypothetical protein
MKAVRSFLVIILIMVVSLPFSISTVSADQQNTPQTVATRTVSLDIKVVLLGFDEKLIDKDYLTWNCPPTQYQLIEIPGISTNTQYSLNYEYVFPNGSFLDDFVHFLQSKAKTETRQNVIWNISYSKIPPIIGNYYLNYTHFAVNSSNTYYPADDVEAWLVQHQADYGGFPANGYVLVLADLSSRLPSTTFSQFELALQGKDVEFTPHFYNKTYTDSDLGVQLNRRYMTGWGGHSRLFFADLSAGPEQTAEQLPIQIASAVNSVDVSGTYGKFWLNQFLSDYVSGAVPDIFAPDFIYPINYASSYKIKVVVFDNRTDTTDPPITETFNQEEAVKQWQALLPWANVTAETKYANISDYPELQQIIVKSRSPATYGSPPGSPAVDARPVYDWLSASGQGHIKDFMQVKRDATEYDIPVFAFAFTGDYEFGFTFKEMIGKEADFDRTIWGVSLYDLVLISHSSNDFKRGDFASPSQPGKGFGFTNTVIHEVGHMLGLMHPFSFDPTENFVASVMAYYPYENIFSIFDRDALARGQADLLLRQTSEVLSETPFVFINQVDISSAKSQADNAEKAYSTMNYLDAVRDSADALQSAERAHLIAGGFMPAGTLVTLEIVGSFVLGVLITYLVLRRRGRAAVLTVPTQAQRVTFCSTCGKPLTWIAQYSRWYCYNCQKYE